MEIEIGIPEENRSFINNKLSFKNLINGVLIMNNLFRFFKFSKQKSKLHLLIYIYFLSFSNLVIAQKPFSCIDTKHAAMGHTGTASTEGASVLMNNVAGLVFIENQSISVESGFQDYTIRSWMYHVDYSQKGIQICYLKKNFGILGSFWQKGVKSREMVISPEFTIESIFYERLLLLGFAHEVLSNLAIGISCKYNNSGSPSYHIRKGMLNDIQGFSIDSGILYKQENFSVGLSVNNLLSIQIDYIIFDEYGNIVLLEKLERNFNLGTNYSPVKILRLFFDIKNLFEPEVPWDDSQLKTFRSYHFGLELNALKNFSFRSGLTSEKNLHRTLSTYWGTHTSYRRRYIFTTGFGFKLKGFQSDFAIVFDNRKKDIEKKTTSILGPIVVDVEGSTFKFLVSTSLEF